MIGLMRAILFARSIAFVDALDLGELGFEGVEPAATGRPAYHPSVLLKLYIYGYLNRVQSSRRLEREAGRNLEVIWLLGRLVPDDKTIADFRKDNGPAIRKVCASSSSCAARWVCSRKRASRSTAASSKRSTIATANFTRAKIERRRAAARGERRAVSDPARHGGLAGAVGSARAQDDAAQGEARQAESGDERPRGDGEADVGLARSADIID